MLGVTETTIDPDELMQRVRAEARRRRSEDRQATAPLPVDDRAASSWGSFNENIHLAESSAVIGAKLPPMSTLRGLKRRLATPIARLVLRVAQLVTRDQNTFNHAALAALRALGEALTAHLKALDQRTIALRSELGTELREIATELAETAERDRALEERLANVRLEPLEQAIAETRDRFTAQLADMAQSARAERARAERLRTQLLLQERRISLLLEETRRRASGVRDATPAPAGSDPADHLLDTFYASFEDHFRGSREEIKERAREYLDTVRAARAGTADRPVLDVGCGRGEWLELLKETGLHARGVDLNQAMIAECRERGFEVVESDALTYLRSLPEGSVGAVTGIHILEHLPFTVVVKLLDETVRVLQPGGVAIFETPNPENLLVGACRFYVDPTHRNPLHPYTMAFILEARGLSRIEVRPLHPADESLRFPETDSPIAKRLNEYFFGPQDFAVVGYRA